MPGESPRRTFLAMPMIGDQSMGAGRGFWRASRGESARIPLDMVHSQHGGSLLAHGFNGMWCEALNSCHKGKPVHYFAMLHADVEPEDGWLDSLVEELEARGLDVLGAVVPIKDPKGLTSLALDRDDGETFVPLCRLTMREVHQLPETFTSEDLGHRLLLNTGCWVFRFNFEVAKKLFFTINDRIVFNKTLDLFMPQVESEDWFFSRLCHELGLKIAATRKVRLCHKGPQRFVNDVPWGQEEFDTVYVSESQIPAEALPAEDWRFPGDVDGWLSRDEGKALGALAKDKRVLEVGSYCGLSTICMAQTARKVVSVDPHDGRATGKPQPTCSKMLENVERYGLTNVESYIGTLADMAATWQTYLQSPEFDLIFIDGDHALEAVRSDIADALPLLAEGGLVVFHDYRNNPGQYDGRWDPGVTQAVDELVADGGEIISTHSTLAVVKPPLLTEATHGSA